VAKTEGSRRKAAGSWVLKFNLEYSNSILPAAFRLLLSSFSSLPQVGRLSPFKPFSSRKSYLDDSYHKIFFSFHWRMK
jgi:hypothetical protein